MGNPLQSILCSCGLKKMKERTSKVKAKSSLPEHLCRRFSLDEIRAATNNFDPNLVLGRGVSCVVYKGSFDDGALVLAVKRLMGSSRRLEDFRNEVQLLCQLHHQHLNSLIGFCEEDDEKVVVVNYMSQGSLFDHLHGTRYDPLTWKQRLEICIGAARGLHYLHAGAKRAVVHRDIKTKNILLDDRMVSKIADFAMSKIGPFSLSNAPIRIELPPVDLIDEEISLTRKFGTVGYVAPELFIEATLVTDKADIYSFGVVLFEVLSGRKAITSDVNFGHRLIIPWVKHHIKTGTASQIIDPYLKGKIAPGCLEKFLEIALSCVHFGVHKRPAFGQVETTLELALEQQNRADSEMEYLNPNGEVMYDEVVVSSSAYDLSDNDFSDNESDASLTPGELSCR